VKLSSSGSGEVRGARCLGSGLRELRHGGVDVVFDGFNGLLGGLAELLVACVGVADRGLDGGDEGLRTGRGVLAHFVDQGDDLAVRFDDLAFSGLREFGAGAGGDSGQLAVVGDGFLGARLGLGSRQLEELLRVLGSQQLTGGVRIVSSAARAVLMFSSTSFSTLSKVFAVSDENRANWVSKLALVAFENCSGIANMWISKQTL
jgi:hypothetical protein